MTPPKYSLLSLLLLAVLRGSCAFAAESCAQGVPRHVPTSLTGDECPILGRMGDLKLAIPPEYLIGPLAYRGVDIWQPNTYKNTPLHPTLSSDIDTFAIRIRQNNFKPIESPDDALAFRQSYESVRQMPPPDNRWIIIGFDARTYPRPSSREFEKLWRSELGKEGPYHKLPDEWGLTHYLSIQPPTADTTFPRFGAQWEYFYNESENSTFIGCQSTLKKVPPHDPISHCTIYFNAPEIKARAEIDNIRDKADISRWREMEAGVHRILKSFVVETPSH